MNSPRNTRRRTVDGRLIVGEPGGLYRLALKTGIFVMPCPALPRLPGGVIFWRAYGGSKNSDQT